MHHSHRKPAHSLALLLAPIALAVTNALDAKIARTTLEDLLRKSELVLYGVTTTHDDTSKSDDAIVWFRGVRLLKTPQSLATGDVPICEDSMRTDTIDLRKHPGEYVVFARKRGECFSPVAGYKSLVPVKDGAAMTFEIDEELATQQLDEFLDRIRKLLQGATP